MSCKLYIESGVGELRTALIKDGRAQDVQVFRSESPNITGAIYRARVSKAGQGGDIFLDLGQGHQAHMSHRRAKAGAKTLPDEGAFILVQISRAADGDKQAEATTRLRLAGRYAVLDKYAKDGVILRGAAQGVHQGVHQGVGDDAVRQEIDQLRRQDARIAALKTPSSGDGPECLVPAPDPLTRVLRDKLPPGCDAVLFDDPMLIAQAKQIARDWPDVAGLIRYDGAAPPLFERDGIAEDLDAVISGRVPLPQGAWLDIHITPALTAIDVNAGAMPDTGDAARQLVNTRAAQEIARHIRLQNIGGLIVIDFIDVAQKGAAAKLLAAFDKALEQDKARVRRGRFSEFGLLEVNREKTGPALAQILRAQDAPCLSAATQGYDLLRQARRLGLGPGVGALSVTAEKDVIAWLHARSDLIKRCEEVTKRAIILTSRQGHRCRAIDMVRLL